MTEKFTEIITSTVDGALERQCADILERIGYEYIIASITYFFEASDEDTYLLNNHILQSATSSVLKDCPLVSYVSQKPMGERLVAEILYIKGTPKVERDEDYFVLCSDGCEELLTQGIHFPSAGDIGEQSAKVFGRLRNILESESFAVSDIVRQWNYISHITAVNDGIQNYQLFNDARSDFYETTEWSNGYPAATGIGCDSGGVMVVVYAIKGFKGVGKQIDNPLQIPAHKYSGEVLASGKEAVRTTPKFERGRLLGNIVFVSGTAAIKGENSEFSDDACVQAKEAIDVVEHLVAPSNISKDCVNFRFDLLRVYVRRPQDMEVIQNIFKAHFRDIPTHFLIADICRPELLLELEGIGHILMSHFRLSCLGRPYESSPSLFMSYPPPDCLKSRF